ncbi:MAG: heme-binding domain-containing protein [Candidatus Obscuribacterales bacterium]|nr:heme-binding domain-containing protein [Candidatus Obscuribacterales bacterium]
MALIKRLASIFLLSLLILALALPLSNYLLQRARVKTNNGDLQFQAFSEVLQNSCVDCHSADLTVYPVYYQLPAARTVIDRDIEIGRAALCLNRDQLRGTEPIAMADLMAIARTVNEGSMPPANYRALHWNVAGGVSPHDKLAILNYVKSKNVQLEVKPISVERSMESPQKLKLGAKLYVDKRLSSKNSLSCASCHNLEKGGADGLPFPSSEDGRKGRLNTPSVFNSRHNFRYFWDGRFDNLNALLAGHLEDSALECSDALIAKLCRDPEYIELASQAYPDKPFGKELMVDSLAAYVGSLTTPSCKFDRYLKGERALPAKAIAGWRLFQEKGCVTCHSGVNLGGMSFEKMGLKADYFAYRLEKHQIAESDVDAGRFNVTKVPSDRGKFKVPSLRNVALTSPYFHDGSVKDLAEAVQVMSEFQLGEKLSDKETEELVEFLKSLSGTHRK